MATAPDQRAATGGHTGSRLCAALLPRRRSVDRTPAFVWPMYALLAALAVGYVIVEVLGIEWEWLDGWGVNVFEIVAGVLCCWRAWTMRRGRVVPVLLGVGLLCWAAGDIVLTVHPVADVTPPPPSLADAFYVTFYPVTYFALMLLLRSDVKRFSLASWLDGGVAGLGAAAICAAFAFKAVLNHADGSAARRGLEPGLSGRRRPAPRPGRGRRSDRARAGASSRGCCLRSVTRSTPGATSPTCSAPTRSSAASATRSGGRCRSCSCPWRSGSDRPPPGPPSRRNRPASPFPPWRPRQH